MRSSSKFRRIQCTLAQNKLFPLKKEGGVTFQPVNNSEEILLKLKSEKLVMILVRRYDQHEREADGSKTAKSVSESWRAKILGL